MGKVVNVIIVGVGGQGTLLSSRVLAKAAMLNGFDVKMSEVHGMAQRGGSVVTQVRFGPKVYSPLIRMGEADVVLAFEKLEALRLMPYLAEGGRLIVNDLAINPLPVMIRAAKYPDQEAAAVKEQMKNSCFFNATAIAEGLGEPRAANLVLLGAMARYLDIPEPVWEEAIKATVPAKAQEVNLAAFKAGEKA
ncbi:MAG: indolepyruvate oxidoreductase subunit beta [Firmicutes bacterium]|nr:indolepyruvate oxidoreductase subunit beta [Bacillota bacterium]